MYLKNTWEHKWEVRWKVWNKVYNFENLHCIFKQKSLYKMKFIEFLQIYINNDDVNYRIDDMIKFIEKNNNSKWIND